MKKNVKKSILMLFVLIGASQSMASVYSDAILADNPVAYWRFNDPNALATNAIDETGSYNGTYSGAAHGSTIAGPALADMGANNYAVSFDGVDDYLDATTLGSLGSNLADGFTFEAWVNTTDTTVQSLFSTVSTGSVTQQIHLLTNRDQFNANVSGALEAYYRDNAVPNNYVKWYADYNTGFNDGEWHHLVETMDAPNGTTILYLDGAPLTMTMKLTSSADTFVNWPDFLAIGAYNSAGSVVLNWAGTMDEVAIYNSVLTSGQIADHYAASGAIAPADADGPYVIRNGQTINLFGCQNDDPGIVGWNWDLDGDSVTDIAGEVPSVSYDYLVNTLGLAPDRDSPYTISLSTVYDSDMSGYGTTTITIIDEPISGIYIEAELANQSPWGATEFTDIDPDNFTLSFRIKQSSVVVDANDIAEFEFRELFSDQVFTVSKILPSTDCSEGFIVEVNNFDITLVPGAYQVRIDIRDGTTATVLTDDFPGSAWLYARMPGESDRFAKASFYLAYLATSLMAPTHDAYTMWLKWDDTTSFAAPLPGTLDPLNAGTYDLWRTNILGESLPRILHENARDGGLGFLAGVRAFRMLGLNDRVSFCEDVIKRICLEIDRFQSNGSLHYWQVMSAASIVERGDSRSEGAHVAAFIGKAAAYFYNAGQTAYADMLMGKLQTILTNRLASGWIGVEWDGIPEHRWTDGRCLGAFTEYERASYIGGTYPTTLTSSILPYADVMADECLIGVPTDPDYGNYDPGYGGFGSLNMAYALLPLKEALGSLDPTAYPAQTAYLSKIEQACQATVGWLTAYPNWGNSSTWTASELNQILSDYMRLFGRDPDKQAYRDSLSLTFFENSEFKFKHRFDGAAVCGVFLTQSNELDMGRGDIQNDNYIDLSDFVLFAEYWMQCNNMIDINCQ